MKIYQKFEWQRSLETVPSLKMQIEEVPCYRCGFVTRIAVRPEYTDWKNAAETYREYAEKLQLGFDQIIKDVDLLFPEENPIRKHIENQWKFLLMEMRKSLES